MLNSVCLLIWIADQVAVKILSGKCLSRNFFCMGNVCPETGLSGKCLICNAKMMIARNDCDDDDVFRVQGLGCNTRKRICKDGFFRCISGEAWRTPPTTENACETCSSICSEACFRTSAAAAAAARHYQGLHKRVVRIIQPSVSVTGYGTEFMKSYFFDQCWCYTQRQAAELNLYCSM